MIFWREASLYAFSMVSLHHFSKIEVFLFLFKQHFAITDAANHKMRHFFKFCSRREKTDNHADSKRKIAKQKFNEKSKSETKAGMGLSAWSIKKKITPKMP